MKAIVYTEYGPPDVLQMKEVAKPVPKDDELLVRIHAASVNAGDWHAMRAEPFYIRFFQGLFKPKKMILGDDFAGRVKAVGSKVTKFQPGDAVFGVSDGGSFAEYRCVTEKQIGIKPANLSFEQAAAVPIAGITALQCLRDKGHIQPGHKVLIIGASGGVGTFAIQIAKSYGAEVTAVCSTKKLDMARSIGADHLIDYTVADFTQSGQIYDFILAINGYHPISAYHRVLSREGIYVCIGGASAQYFQAAFLGPLISLTGRKKMGIIFDMEPDTQELLNSMKDLLEAEKVIPIIDKCYPLPQVPDAIRYVEEIHTTGKVVIQMMHNNN